MNIITDIKLNGITKGIDKKNSNLKKLFSCFSNIDADSLNKLKLIQDNIEFSDLYSDMITKIRYKDNFLNAIKRYNYERTTRENYPFAEYNHVLTKKKINKLNNGFKVFDEELELLGSKYTYFVQDNFLIFYKDKVEFYFNIKDINLIDCKITPDYFIYLLVNKGNKQYIIKTHLAKDFAFFDKEESKLDYEQLYYMIQISDRINEYTEIISIKNNKIVLFSEDLFEFDLIKKYYFISDGYIYFNHLGELKNYKNQFEEVIQTNFNNIYNYQNFLGLNDFSIKDKRISTFEIETFKNIMKFKFDNTFNGGTNYFIVKNFFDNTNDGKIFKIRPSYQIYVNDDDFNITGNFCHNFEKGKFKIEIKDKTISLYKYDAGVAYSFIESCKIANLDEFYFKQLKFQNNKLTFPEYYELEINVEDDYVFKQEMIDVKFDKIHSSKKNVSSFLEKDKEKSINSFEFKNGSICFNNVFDWKNKRFIYNNLEVELKANSYFRLKDIKNFYCTCNYDIKNNVLIPRNNCKLIYSEVNEVKYNLLNENGYVSEFWLKNEGKEVYFKKENNSVYITDSPNEADFSCKIPFINNYININKNKHIDIKINNEMEFILNNNPKLLATTKFLNEPLFYKTLIEDVEIEDIQIYDDKNNYLENVLIEETNNGIIVYFNKMEDRKYYYYKNGEIIYFEPTKSHLNLNNYYYFDEIGKIKFDKIRKLKMISLNTKDNLPDDFICSLFILNTDKNETRKINIDKNSINKIFEVDINTNYIWLSSEIDNINFYLTETSATSLVEKDDIIYFKKDYKEICYISEEPDFNIDLEEIKKTIQTNKKYKWEGKLIEEEKGNITFTNLLDNSIYIEEKNKNIKLEKTVFKTFSTKLKDKFYIENFKSLNTEHEFLDDKSSLFISTENKRISL